MTESSVELPGKPSVFRMLIPLLLTMAALGYTWVKLLSGHYVPQWQHYLAVVGFVILLALYWKNAPLGTVAMGIYLILSITTIFGLSYNLSSFAFGIGSRQIPLGDLTSWAIFLLFIILNIGAIFEFYFDWQQEKISPGDN